MFNPFSSKRFRSYDDPVRAVRAVHELYAESTGYLHDQFRSFIKDGNVDARVHAFYPCVRLNAQHIDRKDMRLSYGFVPKPGMYEATLTRPDVFGTYYQHQFEHLIHNHQTSLDIGFSDTPIPIHFALQDDFHLEADLSADQLARVPFMFDIPDMNLMVDDIANGTYDHVPGHAKPLSLFNAQRVDLSLMRLRHYTGTSAPYFQNFVIFTNYQFYIDEFCKIGATMMRRGDTEEERAQRSAYTAFAEPGNRITYNKNIDTSLVQTDEVGFELRRMPQMPAYHLMRDDHCGITMVNIGVGPSNAKTITDHIAVLRPHAWMMLGHCAGLRNAQNLGDYVLAHGYLREDNVLYHDLHPSIPIPALSEIQIALEKAVADVTGLDGYDLKKIMRTGTVATVDDRNWELRPTGRQFARLSQSRAVALDMESGTIAANGFRYRVPYGTLLCVSDKPLHGQLKLPGMAESFYRKRVEQHLQIGLRAMEMLRDTGVDRLHSRKLRSFDEVAFQ
jgi:AMP nucleosidase